MPDAASTGPGKSPEGTGPAGRGFFRRMAAVLHPMSPSRHQPAPPLPEAQEFAATVREVCMLMGATVESFQGDRVRLYGRITGLVDLGELHRTCRGLPRSRWRGVVEAHLTGLARARDEQVPLDDPAVVRPLLRSRLVAPRSAPSGALTRTLAAGLVETLVVRSGEGIATLPRAAVRAWGADQVELFQLGRNQVLDDGLLARENVDLGGVRATVLEDPSPFTTTHVFWLATYLDVGAAGALVAMPTQTLVLAHALRDDTALEAVQTLLLNAKRQHAEGPRPLSIGLYWWRADRPLLALPANVTASRISFFPPPEFVAVVSKLPPA